MKDNQKSEVTETASLLDISEYQVFEISYAEWFLLKQGQHKETVESAFSLYINREIVPFWVMYFCRRLLKIKRDNLNIHQFVDKTERTQSEKDRGYENVAWMVFWGLLTIALTTSAINHMTRECMTLLCY